MDIEPLYEKYRYHPEQIETKWQKAWATENTSELTGDDTAATLFGKKDSYHQGNARFFIFQDFYNRYQKLYKKLSIPTNSQIFPTAKKCSMGQPSALLQMLQELGCETHEVSLLPPYQTTSSGYLTAAAYQNLVNNLRNDKKRLSKENLIPISVIPENKKELYGIDILRVSHLRNKNIEKECHWENMDFRGSSRFVQRVWRLARPDIDTIPKIRDGEYLTFDYEIVEHTENLLTQILEALKYRSPHILIAALMTQTNRLYEYVYDRNGAHRNVFEQSVRSLILLLHPATPHLCSELWASSSSKG